MGRNVLVSGGAGFLGSQLIDRLLLRSDVASLIAVDDLSSGSRANLAHIADPRLTFVEADIVAFRGQHPFDEIYHLASPAAPLHYMAHPAQTIATNVAGALGLLPQLAPDGRFCFTSTSEIYGDPDVSPQPESYRGRTDSVGPRSSYVEAKRCTEALLAHARISQGVDTRIVRLFNSYGPRMRGDDGRAIPRFIAQALAGQPLTVHGDGAQRRSWGYVDDIVEGMARFFWRDDHRHGGPVNIGNDEEVAVIDLARHIAAQVAGAAIVFAPALPDDPSHRRPDLTLCRRLLPGWSADTGYREGIARTLAWARQERGR
jgi:nucleoside-diphosphate-sugar epimerase